MAEQVPPPELDELVELLLDELLELEELVELLLDELLELEELDEDDELLDEELEELLDDELPAQSTGVKPSPGMAI
jgi:transposase